MIPESVKARIEKIADEKFPLWMGEYSMMQKRLAYISGATAEYERAQPVAEALKSCLSLIEELKEHGVTQWSGEISAAQSLKNYNQ